MPIDEEVLGVSSFSVGREELNDVVDDCLRASTEIHGVAACSFESDGLGDGNAVCKCLRKQSTTREEVCTFSNLRLTIRQFTLSAVVWACFLRRCCRCWRRWTRLDVS